MKPIPLIDVQAQYQRLKDKIQARTEKVYSHGHFILGPEVTELELRLAEFAGAKYAVTCASGTDALILGLMAKETGGGQAVFLPAFTFVATAESVARTGARPVFVDIDPKTKNMDPADLERKIIQINKEGKFKSAGIIAVDLFGLPAEYGALQKIAQKYGLFLLEDAAQSFGAEYERRRAGNLADIAATSFFPAKPLGCYGDGGAIFTNDSKTAEILKSLRVHGQGKDKYETMRHGLNSRLDTLQAAVLLSKLEIFPEEIERRNEIARLYNEIISPEFELPEIPASGKCAWAQYSVCHKKRDKIRDHLERQGISTAIYYPVPLPLQPVYKELGYQRGDFPVSEKISETIFSLPIHPYLKDEEVQFIVHELKTAINE